MAKKENSISEYYDYILDNVSKMSKALEFNSPIELLAYCKTLIYRGCLSEVQYKYGTSYLGGFDGTTIMTGRGNDVVLSCLLSDVLAKREFSADVMGILTYSKLTSLLFGDIPSVGARPYVGKKITTTICLDNDNWYLLDVKNADLLNILENGIVISTLSGKKSTISLDEMMHIPTEETLKRLSDIRTKRIWTHDEYLNIYNRAYNRCQQNIPVFEGLYQLNKDAIEGICHIKRREFRSCMDDLI